MFTKLQNRLLTRRPLLWNTKLVWMAFSLLIIHVLFLLSGFVITARDFKNYHSLPGVLEVGLLTFSFLCSLVIIIVWLVFYLRNNAYKNFMVIGKYHLAKEFSIIFLILLFCICFFESYKWGTAFKAMTITNEPQLVKEANTVNLAMAFLPLNKGEFFKVNNCDRDNRSASFYQEGHDYSDSTAPGYNDSINVVIRNALKDKDAFSYKNFCTDHLAIGGYKGYMHADQWKAIRNRWLTNHETDSIKLLLEQLVFICKKYDVAQHIDIDEMSRLPFNDSFFTVSKTIASEARTWQNGAFIANPFYVELYDLTSSLNFAESCQLASSDRRDDLEMLTVELYVALCLAILLFCYRLFSRRTFLVSFVGSIVWTIIFLLFGISSSSGQGILWIFVTFAFFFLIGGLLLIKGKSAKTAAGALLNWHIYMAPFILMFIAMLINTDFEKARYTQDGFSGFYLDNADLKKNYPVGYWVHHHMGLVFRLNLLLVFLYVIFVFTRFSKKWHIMPEE